MKRSAEKAELSENNAPAVSPRTTEIIESDDLQYVFEVTDKPNFEYKNSIRRIEGRVKLNDEIIGTISGNIIRRGGAFYSHCDSISEEIQHCSVLFFKSDGKLSSEMKEKVHTSCNQNGYLHVDQVKINKVHRGKDLGLKLFQKVLEQLFGKWSIAFIQPMPLNAEKSDIPFREGVTKLSQYFSRLGFIQGSNNEASDKNEFWYLDKTAYTPNILISKEQSKQLIVTLPIPKRIVTDADKQLTELVTNADTGDPIHSNTLVNVFKSEVPVMLRAGADLNSSTALHYAVANKKNALIVPLIELGKYQ